MVRDWRGQRREAGRGGPVCAPAGDHGAEALLAELRLVAGRRPVIEALIEYRPEAPMRFGLYEGSVPEPSLRTMREVFSHPTIEAHERAWREELSKG